MKILAIDGNSLLNRAYYGVRDLKTIDGTPTNAVYGFLTVWEKIDKELSPDMVAVAFDRKEPTFRHQAYEGYKANRHGMPDDLAQQLPLTKELITLLGGHVVEKAGFEADDILGTIARLSVEQGFDCVIATGDRDSLQLVQDGVTVRLSTNKEAIFYDSKRVFEQYGVTPKELVDVKALMGDSSDNIPGVKGIGEKTALQIIANYHSIAAIFDDPASLDIPKRAKNLLSQEAAKQQAQMSYKLGKIVTDVPIEQDVKAFMRKQPDQEGLQCFYEKLAFKKFLKKMDASTQPQKQTISMSTLKNPSAKEAQNHLDTCETIDFLLQKNLLIHANDCIIEYTEDVLKNFKTLVCNSPKPKRTDKVKELYTLCLQEGFHCEKITLSVDLAAYLLDSLQKEDTIGATIQKYDIPAMEDETYREISALRPLCDRLTSALQEEKLDSLLQQIELPLSLALAKMEIAGIGADRNGIEAFGNELEQKIQTLTQEIYDLAGEPFNIQSTKELGMILFQKLALPTFKKTKTGYSTNVDVLEKLIKYHPIAEKVLAYRKYAKLHSTYIVGLNKEIAADGRIHSKFRQTETRTGRISSTEPNLQNIPIRTEEGSQIRKFFVAKKGYMLLDADYSQIELRLLAHIAQDKRMIEAFQNGEDIHAATASEVFGIASAFLPAELRRRAKAINFGIVYGIGAYSLSQDIGVSIQQAKEYIQNYLAKFPGVRDYMHDIVEQARAEGMVRTLYGRLRRIPEITSKNSNMRSFGERVALNTPIQGSAADIIKIAMVAVQKRLEEEALDAAIVLQVHDELLVEASMSDADRAGAILQYEMEHAASLSVPLAVEVSSGQSWFDAKG